MTNEKEKMNTVNRLLINICSDKLAESRDFYTTLFDFQVDYDSDWFVHLISKDKRLELGIIDRKNDLVPKENQKPPQGFNITPVVDNVDVIFEEVRKSNIEIVQSPTNTMYGQRRLLLKDPNGTIVDVSSLMTNKLD